jgi:hypothetical protein
MVQIEQTTIETKHGGNFIAYRVNEMGRSSNREETKTWLDSEACGISWQKFTISFDAEGSVYGGLS